MRLGMSVQRCQTVTEITNRWGNLLKSKRCEPLRSCAYQLDLFDPSSEILIYSLRNFSARLKPSLTVYCITLIKILIFAIAVIDIDVDTYTI